MRDVIHWKFNHESFQPRSPKWPHLITMDCAPIAQFDRNPRRSKSHELRPTLLTQDAFHPNQNQLHALPWRHFDMHQADDQHLTWKWNIAEISCFQNLRGLTRKIFESRTRAPYIIWTTWLASNERLPLRMQTGRSGTSFEPVLPASILTGHSNK